jgi:Flp pilus assembly protein TadG
MRIIGVHHCGLWKCVWDACRSICSEQGGALVETAVTMPILFLLLLGAAEFALVEYKAIEVSNAANAAAQYGTSSPISAADTTGIQLAATNDATNVALGTTQVSISCICSNGSASTCAAGDCSSSHIEQILTVQTQASYTPPIHLPGLPMTFALQGLAVRKVLQ